MNTPDRYGDWDAAYVLGALSAAERREFEDHVATCDACRAAVADLAGVPGLLTQVPPGEVLALDVAPEDEAPQPSASLMPEVRHQPRPWLAPVAAAAAALLIGGVGGYAVSSVSRSPSSSAATSSPSTSGPSTTGAPTSGAPAGVVASRLAFSSVQPSSMTAVVDVVPAGANTELRVECQYAAAAGEGGSGKGSDYGQVDYAIWVVDRSGHAAQLKQWTARPGRIMHPTGLARLTASQIALVEIRRVDDGQTVMRARPV